LFALWARRPPLPTTTNKRTSKQTSKQANPQTSKQANKQTCKQSNKRTHTHANKQTTSHLKQYVTNRLNKTHKQKQTHTQTRVVCFETISINHHSDTTTRVYVFAMKHMYVLSESENKHKSKPNTTIA